MRLSGKNILIVDDDPSHRLLLKKILETVGCTVVEAESVRVAIQKIEEKLPDLIILDLSMPEHDGFVFLKFRAQTPLLESVLVLVLSSSSEQAVVDRALALGANQFLEKPLKANLVLQKLRFLFYSQEHFSFQYPEGKEPAVKVEIKAKVTACSENQMKILTQVKFAAGTPLVIRNEKYSQFGGGELVSRVDSRLVDLDEGLYAQYATYVGMSQEEKDKLLAWEKTL